MKVVIRIVIVVAIAVAGLLIWRQKQAEALNRQGVALLEQGKTDEAIRTLEAARGKSGNASIHKNLAVAYEKKGRHQDAADSIDRALDKKPGIADGQKLSDRLHDTVDRKQALRESADQRIERLKSEGRKPDPADLETVEKTIFVLMHMDDYDRAIYVLEAALLQFPDNIGIERRIQEIEKKRDEGQQGTTSTGDAP